MKARFEPLETGMKTKVGTLLAVTLATAAPAAAGPEHAHAHATPAASAAPKPTSAERKAAFLAWEAEQERIDLVLATYGITRPRALRTGAPACGNVQTKKVPEWQVKCFAAHAAEAAEKAKRDRREGNT